MTGVGETAFGFIVRGHFGLLANSLRTHRPKRLRRSRIRAQDPRAIRRRPSALRLRSGATCRSWSYNVASRTISARTTATLEIRAVRLSDSVNGAFRKHWLTEWHVRAVDEAGPSGFAVRLDRDAVLFQSLAGFCGRSCFRIATYKLAEGSDRHFPLPVF